LVGRRWYSLPAAEVLEVAPAVGITVVPRVPPFVLGVVQVAGKVVSVLVLTKLLGLPAESEGATRRLVLVNSPLGPFALGGSDIAGIDELTPVGEPLSLEQQALGLRQNFSMGGQLVTQLDAQRLLEHAEQQCLAAMSLPSNRRC
jgi:purine-binding chemotaxis protein CheW